MPTEENLAWRAHLPDGWHALYDQLMSDIAKCDPEAKVTQAKEKFGELRVYLARFQRDAYDFIDAASRVSRRSCQTCGDDALLCVRKGYFARSATSIAMASSSHRKIPFSQAFG